MAKRDLTGLEMLKQMKNGDRDRPSMGNTIPLKMLEVEYGYALFEAQANENHLNPVGMVHGGFASTVLDSAMGCSLQSTLPASQFFATVDLHIKMLKPVPRDTLLLVEAKMIHTSKRMGVSEGVLKTEDGTVYAHGTTTCMVIEAGNQP